MYLYSILPQTAQLCFQGNTFRSVYGSSSDLWLSEHKGDALSEDQNCPLRPKLKFGVSLVVNEWCNYLKY